MGSRRKITTQILCLLALACAIPGLLSAQYTDVINSNRPGLSVSAYAVGTGVIQAELGLGFEQRDHEVLNSESNMFTSELALRYGLLFEPLEIIYEGRFVNQNIDYLDLALSSKRTDFERNRLGLKFLIYDPFKGKPMKPNLYSWRANNVFQLKNLIPAISIYAGANFVLGDNPFYRTDPTVSPRVMVATQSRLSPRFVLISNVAYDRIGTDFPEWNYTISLQHAFRNPKWSVFVENQGIKSDRYSDVLLRSGFAHLLNENFQIDAYLGANFKNTPSRLFGTLGLSYRLDFHQDKLKPIDEQKPGQNSGGIKRNSMKKKKKGLFGISKKDKRDRKKKKKNNN